MYWTDHSPPHFHARYGDYTASFLIDNFALQKGEMPAKAIGMIAEWAVLHKKELLENWEYSQKVIPFKKIEPLQ